MLYNNYITFKMICQGFAPLYFTDAREPQEKEKIGELKQWDYLNYFIV